MRRHFGDLAPVIDPVARATPVGLPSFNFVEPRRPQDGKKKLPEQQKAARLWQSLQRLSDAGRFSRAGIESPNPITAALCVQVVGQIVRAAAATTASTATSPAPNVLLGALGNCVYYKFDPDVSFEAQQLFADVVTEQSSRIAQLEQRVAELLAALDAAKVRVDEQLRSVTTLFERMPAGERPRAVVESLGPFLDRELLLVLWNATATSTAMRSLEQDFSATWKQRSTATAWEEARKRGAKLATHVLQARVHLVVSLWQTMSREERGQLYKALDPSTEAGAASGSAPNSLKAMLRSLEDAKHEEDEGAALTRDDSDRSPAGGGEVYSHHGGGFAGTLGPIIRVCEDAFDLLCEDAFEVKARSEFSIEKAPTSVGDGGYVVQAKKLLCKLLQALSTSGDAIADKFQRSENARVAALEDASASQAGQHDGAMDEGMSALVHTIIQRQRQNPALLVTAINRSPDILTSAISQNQGILFFAMTKFSGAVKRFLRLDPKACDNLDALTSRNKGIQLLWNGNTTASGAGGGAIGSASGHAIRLDKSQVVGDVTGASDALHLAEWFSAHVGDFAALFLDSPDPLKQLFIEMHERGDVTAFYRLMVLLQSTRGVHSFMTRASIAALERVAQEDQAAVTHLLHSIFFSEGASASGKPDSNGASSTGGTASTRVTAGNQDLLHELRSSPFLVTCLSEFQPGALQDVFATHVDTWASYFVDVVASNDAILRQSLVTRTESVEGGEMVVKLFDALAAGSTGRLNLQLLECAVSGSDAARATEREAAARRKQHQCLYLRGHSTLFSAIISPQIVFASYSPHAGATCARAAVASGGELATTAGAKVKGEGKEGRSGPLRGPRTRRANNSSSAAVSLSASTKKRAAQPTLVAGTLSAGASTDGSSHSVTSCSSVREADGQMDASNTGVRQVGFLTGPDVPDADAPLDAQPVVTIPRCWHMFLRMHRQQQQTGSAKDIPAQQSMQQSMQLTRAQTRSLVLDIWIEFIKADHLQLENASLGALAPFVCDYFVGRYDAPAAVGSWLESLLSAMRAHREDPRVGFFAGACGVFSPPGSPTRSDTSASLPSSVSELPAFDTVLYYLHVLAHLLYGQMKIFKRENHLSEGPDGGCAIAVEVAQATAATVFAMSLTRAASEALQRDLAAVPRVASPCSQPPTSTNTAESAGSRRSTQIGPTSGAAELDDIMAVFLREWQRRLERVDERYKEEFTAQDTGGGRIGLDEFVKIVTTVTGGRVSVRECRLVYADVGLEFLDRDAFVRVTRAYQLRLFDAELPEVPLRDIELQELRASLGRTNIASTQRELEDLVRHWRGVRTELAPQLASLHQKKATKALLKRQSMLVDRLIASVVHQAAPLVHKQHQTEPQDAPASAASASITEAELQPLLDRAWHEVRACVKLLHSAKLTNHYLSGLYIQSSLVKWIRQARRRTQEEERARGLEALSC